MSFFDDLRWTAIWLGLLVGVNTLASLAFIAAIYLVTWLIS